MRAFNLLLIVIVVAALSFGSLAQTIEQPSAYYSLDTIEISSTGKFPVIDDDSIFGKSGNFDGVNDFINAGQHKGEQKLYTLSLWFKTSSTGSMRIFQRGKASACFYDPAIDVADGKLVVSESGCSSAGRIGGKYYQGTPISLGEWNHVVVVRYEDTVQVYLNGKLKLTDNDQPLPPLGTDGSVTIGASWGSRSTYSRFFSGLIDEIKVWNRPFTAAEIQSLYLSEKNNQPLAVQTPLANTAPLSTGLASPTPTTQQPSGGGSGIQISGVVPTVPTGSTGGGSAPAIAGAKLTIPSGGASGISISGTTPTSSQPLEITPFGTITTVAGIGGSGSTGDGDLASKAKLNEPKGVAFDCIGNMYIADTGNHKIRRVEKSTGKITTIAGTGTASFSGDGGSATSAQLSSPTKIGLDSAGNIFISDTGNNKVRKLTPITGSKTLVCSDPTTTPLEYTISTATTIPLEVKKAIEPTGKRTRDDFGNVYIADRITDMTKGITKEISGITKNGENFDVLISGTPTHHGFNVAQTALGVPTDVYYTGDRPVPLHTSILGSVIGDGLEFYFRSQQNSYPNSHRSSITATVTDIAFDSFHNMYFTDIYNHRIRKIDSKTKLVSTIAGKTLYASGSFGGDGYEAGNAMLNSPYGLAFDPFGNLYIADTGNNMIRKVEASSEKKSILATTATGNEQGCGITIGCVTGFDKGGALSVETAKISNLRDVGIDGQGNVYITGDGKLGKVNAGSGIFSIQSSSFPRKMAVDRLGNIYYSSGSTLKKMTPSGTVSDFATGISSGDTENFAIDDQQNIYHSNYYRIKKIDKNGAVTTIAGIGIDCSGPSSGCGDYGSALQAQISNGPLAVDNKGNVYLAGKNTIRKIDAATKTIETIAGKGTECRGGDNLPSTGCDDGLKAKDASIGTPSGIAVDPDGNIYFTESAMSYGAYSGRIRKIDSKTGIITTLAGVGISNNVLPETQLKLFKPTTLRFNSKGNLYVLDETRSQVLGLGGVWIPPPVPLVNTASCEEKIIPTEVKAGQTFTVTLKMKNNGEIDKAKPWSKPAYKLLQQGTEKWGLSSIDLPVQTVNPTEIATFSLTGTAPSVDVPYTFSSIMSESGTIFGTPCEAQIKVNKNCNQYNYIPANSKVEPKSVLTGGKYNIYCDYGKTGITCVKGSAGTVNCPFQGWVGTGGTVAKFECTASQTPATLDTFCELKSGDFGENCCTSGPTKLDTVTVGSPKNDGTCFVRVSPNKLSVEQASSAKIEVQNTGTKTWLKTTHKLFSKSNPANLWGIPEVLLSADVPAGGQREIVVSIKAPSTAGDYTFPWGLKEGTTEFGGSCNAAIKVVPLTPPSQQFVCSAGGTKATLSWGAGKGATSYKLLVDNSQVATPTGTSYDYNVNCGQQYNWQVISSSTAGDSDPTAASIFTCACPVSDGSCTNKNIPSPLNVGQSSTASVTVTNTGDKPWSANHKLVSVNNIWGPTTEIQLPNIAKGSSQDLPISIKAPSTAGSYTFSWSLKDGATSFGIGCPSASVKVLPLAPTGPIHICSADVTKATLATLSWTAGTGATGYGLVIDDTTTASDPKDFETSTTATTYQYSLQCGRQYTWKVRSTSSGGDSSELNGGTINCVCPVSGGSCTNVDVPSKLNIGQTYSAKVKVSNTGTGAWAANTRKLVPTPSSADVWGISEIPLISIVNPGVTQDVTIPIKAPTTPRDYQFTWSLREGTLNFGNLCSQTIKVAPLAPTNLQSSCSADGTKATLSWTAGTGAIGYGLVIDGSSFTSSSTPYVYDKVQCGKQYTWSVKSTSSGVDSSATNGPAFTCTCPVSAGSCSNLQVPSLLDVGQTYHAKVKVSNTGNKVWTTTTHKLVSTSSPANVWGPTEASITSNVNPGATQDITIPLKAPTTAGDYQFNWKMKEGASEFGTACTQTIKVLPPSSGGLKSTCSSDGTKAKLEWAASSGATSYKVIVDNLQVATPTGTSYDYSIQQCGKQYAWKITPTSSAGDSPSSDGTPFNCACPINNAECVNLDAPLTVKINQNFQVSASMKNKGNTAWTNSYSLVSQQPFIIANPAQVSSTVNPQSAVTFTLAAKAPATTGTYDMIWTMKDNLGRTFGQQCRRSILVESPVLEFEGDRLIQPRDVAVDSRGDVYVADAGTNKIKKINRITRKITTIAGTGQSGFFGDGWPATSAKLNSPSGVIIDALNRLYIADTGNNRIRALKIILSSISGGGSSIPIAGSTLKIPLTNPEPMPPSGGDSWDYLPEYQPGESVYEGIASPEPMPS